MRFTKYCCLFVIIFWIGQLHGSQNECDQCVVVEPGLLGGDPSLAGNYRFMMGNIFGFQICTVCAQLKSFIEYKC